VREPGRPARTPDELYRTPEAISKSGRAAAGRSRPVPETPRAGNQTADEK